MRIAMVAPLMEAAPPRLYGGTDRDMVDAVPRIAELDRAACRTHVAECFSPEVMAAGYERAYQQVVNRAEQEELAPV